MTKVTRCSSNSGTPSRRRLPSRKKLRGSIPNALLSRCMCLVPLFSPLFVCLCLFVTLCCCHDHCIFSPSLSLFHCHCFIVNATAVCFPLPMPLRVIAVLSDSRCERRPFLAATATSVVT